MSKASMLVLAFSALIFTGCETPWALSDVPMHGAKPTCPVANSEMSHSQHDGMECPIIEAEQKYLW